MKKIWIILLLALGSLLSTGSAAAMQNQSTVNILMVGNSWLGGAAGHLLNLTAEIGDVWASQVIHGGYNLRRQWNDPNQMAQITAELDKGIYDYAVIIDFAGSVYDLEGTGSHQFYVRLFDDLFKSYGVQTVLLLPWTTSVIPLAQPVMTANEYALAAEIGAIVAPVGEAFELSEQRRPELNMRKSPEDSHPSPYGTYVREMVLYATIMEKSPQELLGQWGIKEEEAQHFKDVAWETVLFFNYGQSAPPTQPPPPGSPTQAGTTSPPTHTPPASTSTPGPTETSSGQETQTPGPGQTTTQDPENGTPTSETNFNFPTPSSTPTPGPGLERSAAATEIASFNPTTTNEPAQFNPPAGNEESFPGLETFYRAIRLRTGLLFILGGLVLLTLMGVIAGIVYLRKNRH